MRQRSRILAFLIVVGSFPSFAFAAKVDWKLYGGISTASTGNTYCFYEEKGISQERLGFARVWTKCLLQRDLDAVDSKKSYDRAVVDMSAERIVHRYRPPFLTVTRANSDQGLQVIMYEAIADVGDINPQAQIFYELDCKQRRLRELHISVGNSSRDTPGDWRDIPPEGNGANLLSLVCH
jgi:hypothetical protein